MKALTTPRLPQCHPIASVQVGSSGIDQRYVNDALGNVETIKDDCGLSSGGTERTTIIVYDALNRPDTEADVSSLQVT